MKTVPRTAPVERSRIRFHQGRIDGHSRGLYLWLVCTISLSAVPSLVGCASLRREPLPPSHSMRTTTSDSLPTGIDDRSRQIESNLGIR